jgi:hypothetical protein
MFREEAEEGLLSWTGESDTVLKTRFLNSLAPKALLVAVAAGGVFLIGGVANADTPGGSQDTGTGSPIGGLLPGGAGGLDLGHLVGPVLQPILGGLSGGTGGLDPVRLVGPILQPILGGSSGGTGGLGLGQLTGPLLGGLG